MPVSSTPSDTVSVISSSLILPISSKEAFVLIVSNDLEFPPNTTQETADALQRTLDENFNLKEFNFDPSTGKFTYVINSNYDFGSNETSGEISLQELITNHINEFYLYVIVVEPGSAISQKIRDNWEKRKSSSSFNR